MTMRASWKTRVVVVALLVAAVFPAAAQNVTLTDGGTTVTLDNGVVSATFSKSSGNCSSLSRNGGANVLANGGKLYFDANGSTGTNASAYYNFTPDAYRVVTNTASLAEIAITDTNLTGFSAELHYAMRTGDSGFYVFIVWRHGAGNPVSMLEQSRTVMRCDPNVFTLAYASTNKFGQMIAPSLLAASLPQISDATYKLPLVSSYTNVTGQSDDHYPVYTKYDWAEYTENHAIEGLTSDTTGLWMLFGGSEYFNGGPTRANLILHGTETTPLLLWDFHAQHFGGVKTYMTANQNWTKLVGPAFVYVNTGASSAELWADAQQRAAAEQAAWPYVWMSEANYPVARGVVAGQLHVLGESCSNALLVLAQHGTNWWMQSDGYEFWTRAAADGSFAIPKVRAGNYSLFARVPGIVGEFELTNVTVVAGQTNSVGLQDWTPPRRAQRLWRIGTPDLGAGEFRFGSDMRAYGLWYRYLDEQGTNDLVYRIGSSVATNWYYANSVVPLDGGTYLSPNWKVEFVLTNLPPSPVVLTIDLAGGVGGNLQTKVNGTSLADIVVWGDSCITRSATRSGAPRHHELSFSPGLLQLGTNTVVFSVSKSSTWSGTKPTSSGRGVIWDSVQLEAGALVTQVAPRITSVSQSAGQVAISGSGGLPGGTYRMLAATNAALPLSVWTPLVTNQFDGGGNFTFSTGFAPGAPLQFFRLQLP
jgi:rhamnogalacturonan endolyase